MRRDGRTRYGVAARRSRQCGRGWSRRRRNHHASQAAGRVTRCLNPCLASAASLWVSVTVYERESCRQDSCASSASSVRKTAGGCRFRPPGPEGMAADRRDSGASRTGTDDGNQRGVAREAPDAEKSNGVAATEVARRTREALCVPPLYGGDACEARACCGSKAEGSPSRRLTPVSAPTRREPLFLPPAHSPMNARNPSRRYPPARGQGNQPWRTRQPHMSG